MRQSDEIAILRARDFWASIALFALALFFLWKTSAIPLFGENRAGVSGSDWYSSAAVVPLGIFGALLLLSLGLLTVSIRSGGARRALSAAGIGWNRSEALRFSCIALILLAYIAGLTPRVDFIIASGLLISALIYGFHGNYPRRGMISALIILAAAAYAGFVHPAQAEWNAHDDDWLALFVWIGFSALILWQGRGSPVLRLVPVLSVVVPLLLVCVMAFGFRQNVPARGGLLFSQIEYHYFVTFRAFRK